MPTETLSAGMAHSILQNVIYALPPSRNFIQSQAVVQLSLTTTTTDFVNVATSTTGVETASIFVRCSTGNTIIAVKKM